MYREREIDVCNIYIYIYNVQTAEEVRRYEYEPPSEPIQLATGHFVTSHETVQVRRGRRETSLRGRLRRCLCQHGQFSQFPFAQFQMEGLESQDRCLSQPQNALQS